ncbi:hypothetical protein ACWD1W_35480 [Streptomyces olivaceoviridis]
MTVLEDRTEMAEESDGPALDALFESLERTTPEGYKVDIVGGAVFMTPQRDTDWEIIAGIFEQLRTKYPRKRVKSDVRIDYPGHLNGFCSDVTLVAEGAEKTPGGLWRCGDVEFVAEVVSKGRLTPLTRTPTSGRAAPPGASPPRAPYGAPPTPRRPRPRSGAGHTPGVVTPAGRPASRGRQDAAPTTWRGTGPFR